MEHRVFGVLFACVLACTPVSPVAAQQPPVLEEHCDVVAKDITPSMAVDLIDPVAPKVAREKALAAFMAASTGRVCPTLGYRIGLLYRFGSELPGNLLQQDTGKARDLILAYAEEGHLFAYGDLAEMALKNGDAREAMKWTQVYLALLTNIDAGFRAGTEIYGRSGYNGDLLARAQKLWGSQRPRLAQGLMQDDLTQYLGQHKDYLLERAPHADDNPGMGPRGGGGLKAKPMRGKCEVDLRNVGGAFAIYLLEVQPDGHVSRVAIEDFAPKPEVAIKLAQCIKLYDFEPFEGMEARTGIVPVFYGYTDGPRISK